MNGEDDYQQAYIDAMEAMCRYFEEDRDMAILRSMEKKEMKIGGTLVSRNDKKMKERK